MRRAAVDPASLEGEELERWYRRSPDEIEAEREAARSEDATRFFGSQGEIVLAEGPGARAMVRPPVYRPPPPPETRAATQPSNIPLAPQQGFFASHPLGTNTGLPGPLDYVEPSVVRGDRYKLSDGTLVDADELERIYAEQDRLIRGVELAPSPYAKATDRLPDGVVPRADQLVAKQWERDPTCHPYGGWELDTGYKSKRSEDYEAQITGARGVDYVVRMPGRSKPVKFDGCDVVNPRHPLQEAKGPGHWRVFEAAMRYGFMKGPLTRIRTQTGNQLDVAGNHPIQWFIAEKEAIPIFAMGQATKPIERIYEPAK